MDGGGGAPSPPAGAAAATGAAGGDPLIHVRRSVVIVPGAPAPAPAPPAGGKRKRVPTGTAGRAPGKKPPAARRPTGTRQEQSTLEAYPGMRAAVEVATRLRASAARMQEDTKVAKALLGAAGECRWAQGDAHHWGDKWYASRWHPAVCTKTDAARCMLKGLAVLEFLPAWDGGDVLCIALTHIRCGSDATYTATGGTYKGLQFRVRE
jgi:hypothetical protein